MMKTALTLSMLLPLAGCFDFGWSKKENKAVKSQAAQPGVAEEKAGKCSHKGCTHDHSKDAHKKHEHSEVQTQDMEEDDEDMDNVQVQDLEDDEDEMDEDFN